MKPAAEDHELVHPDKKNKVDESPFTMELEAALQQHKMEYETLQKVNTSLVNENRELKEKAEENKLKVKDMKLMIKAMTTGNDQKLHAIRMMFLSKKTQLTNIIMSLKQKLNTLNKEVDVEIRIRDTLLDNEQAVNRRLRSEVIKAKDVLMTNELSLKAKDCFKKLVDLNNDEKVLLDDGSLHDLFQRDNDARQTFEYVKQSNKTADDQKLKVQKRYRSNQIAFRNLSNLQSVAIEKRDRLEDLQDSP